jgi:hypothetical protein
MTRLARERRMIPWDDFSTLFGAAEVFLTALAIAIVITVSERDRLFKRRSAHGKF